MAVGVVVDDLGEGGGGDYVKETKIIPDGFQLCRLVSYVEMGHHIPTFKGVQQKYEAPSKRVGEIKDPEMMIHLVFEFTDCEHTGDFPLNIRYSSPWGDKGDLLSKFSMSKGLEEGWCSRSIALKQNYVKALMAMQDACKCTCPTIAEFVGEVFGCTIKHTLGKKANDAGDIPTYANMDVTALVAPEFKNPMTKEVMKMDLSDMEGSYCDVFDWAEPTIEAWAAISEYLKKFIMKAADYKGSALELMLNGLSEEPAKKAEESTDTDSPATAQGDAGAEIPDDDIPF